MKARTCNYLICSSVLVSLLYIFFLHFSLLRWQLAGNLVLLMKTGTGKVWAYKTNAPTTLKFELFFLKVLDYKTQLLRGIRRTLYFLFKLSRIVSKMTCNRRTTSTQPKNHLKLYHNIIILSYTYSNESIAIV